MKRRIEVGKLMKDRSKEIKKRIYIIGGAIMLSGIAIYNF